MEGVQILAKKEEVFPQKNHLLPAAFSRFIMLITLADAATFLSVHKLYSVYLPSVNTDSQTFSHRWSIGLVSFTRTDVHLKTASDPHFPVGKDPVYPSSAVEEGGAHWNRGAKE